MKKGMDRRRFGLGGVAAGVPLSRSFLIVTTACVVVSGKISVLGALGASPE